MCCWVLRSLAAWGKPSFISRGQWRDTQGLRKGLHTFLPTGGWLIFFSFLNSSSRKGSFRLFVHYLHLTAFWFGQQLADAYLPQWQGQGCSEVFVVGQPPPLCSSHFRAFHPLLQAMPVLTFAITEIFRGGVRETNGKGWEGQYF